ncbi:MAG: hypothetical protein IGR80_13350 [Synechococcales cyanobacterium K44_A2020_017]|nr:hypothetical protein [Synechococcales cyanobacterium K32_A2020_035]MBF2095729.1 hypothetical protein [Synechococcales cyanobacterium K44_A2020_017]
MAKFKSRKHQKRSIPQVLMDKISKVLDVFSGHPVELECEDPPSFTRGVLKRLYSVAIVTSLIIFGGVLILQEGLKGESPIKFLVGSCSLVFGILSWKWLDPLLKKPLTTAWNSIYFQGYEQGKYYIKAKESGDIKKLHMYYVGRILEGDQVDFRNIRLASVPGVLTLDSQDNSASEDIEQEAREACSIMKRQAEERVERARIRYSVTMIPSDFWNDLAVNAIREALSVQDTDNPDDALASDLYTLLSAWLVCSIDNDDRDCIMPIDVIKLRYRTSGEVLDLDSYIRSLDCVQEILRENQNIWDLSYMWGDERVSSNLRSPLIHILNEKIDRLKCEIRKK